ncbi:Six-hairpin glycosidase-like protein [Podospora appendiculata]|uniref:Six-hairpin glycosidase-like protein n=1 Tax=Podospora appendiculata TaxID=314037 RepID=A0AAE1CCL7_9PEZI|nr:Six-hairpin glycosidase-like protein [Podospora appendiculata]
MPAEIHGINASDVHAKIRLLIDGLVNIKDQTGEFLLKLDDGRVIDTKGWDDWEWTHGVGLYGIWQYYELAGDPQYLAIIEAWFAARFAAGGTTKNINTMAVFLTLALVYERTRNPTYLPWLDGWGEWAYRDLARTKYGGMQHVTYLSAHDQQLWDDTLMMTVLPLAKIGQVLHRPHYVAEAKKQFLIHLQYLFDTGSGLFFHGWTFAEGGHNFARARWARGNSWLTIAIPEFLELLEIDDGDPIGAQLINVLSAQVEALQPLQTSAGLWRTLLDVSEEEGSYVESSATAGFAFGILKAQRKRYIGREYDETAVKAVRAVLDKIDARGELADTSFGTAMGTTLQHYLDIPITSMPYGQAMAVMALVEFLRAYI